MGGEEELIKRPLLCDILCHQDGEGFVISVPGIIKICPGSKDQGVTYPGS